MNPSEKIEKKGGPLIAIDTETGGVFPSINPLLSISIVPSCTMEPLTFYIEPMPLESIHPKAAALNGYSHALWMERGALPLGHVIQRFHKVLSDCLAAHPDALILAHNAGFDRVFIEEAYRVSDYHPPHRHQWRCSMALMGQLMDQGLIPQGKLSLDRLGELSGQWPVGGRPAVHEAHEDALACLIGYQWLLSIQARPMQLLRRYWDLSAVGGGRTADWLQINGEAEALLSPLPPTNPPA